MTVNTSTVTMSSYNRRVEHRPEAVLRACRGSLRYISRAALTPGAQRWNPLRGPALGFPTMGWDPRFAPPLPLAFRDDILSPWED